MATEPPVQSGQLSPDGLWRWDGVQWVPVASGVAPAPPARTSKTWIWWLAGGCAVLLVLGLIPLGFAVSSIVNGIRNGAFECLPSDFPAYPGATTVNFNTNFSGGTKRCSIALESDDGVAAVTSFYEQRLSSGDWKVVSSDPSTGEIRFQRVSRPSTSGVIQLLGKGQHSEIDIQLESDR